MVKIEVPEPKTKRGVATRSKIMKAAERLFGEKGYYDTSINDIATKAKVAPGTIYIYFKDKFTLYCYLLNDYSHLLRSEIVRKIKELDCKTRREAEEVGMLHFLQTIQEHPYIYQIIWESLYIDKSLFIDYYTNFAEHYTKGLDKAFADEEISKFDNEVIAYMLMGIVNFIGLRYVFFKKDRNLEDVVGEVMEVLDKGLFRKP
ncbi:MAG: TetR/AcrR family transcriptional regulator [Clostridia bacterium]|nr:TetR/AcrR family transcriptional regulator [Clostridia bacterium]